MTNEVASKLWTPQVIQGGKASEPPSDEPWLQTLEIGTVFLAQNVKDPIICGEWEKLDFRPNVSKIAQASNHVNSIWVVDKNFCEIHKLMAILEHK